MKIIDLQVEDCRYGFDNDIPREVQRLNYPQKYILLKIDDDIFSLGIDEITTKEVYLKIIDDKNLKI